MSLRVVLDCLWRVSMSCACSPSSLYGRFRVRFQLWLGGGVLLLIVGNQRYGSLVFACAASTCTEALYWPTVIETYPPNTWYYCAGIPINIPFSSEYTTINCLACQSVSDEQCVAMELQGGHLEIGLETAYASQHPPFPFW